jgi:hypothetical protein
MTVLPEAVRAALVGETDLSAIVETPRVSQGGGFGETDLSAVEISPPGGGGGGN